MKNKRFERNRVDAKKYLKKWWRRRELTELGNAIYHVYDNPENKKTEGWWDDVAFVMGSQVVSVWWIHPRMAYHDKCSNLAQKATDEVMTYPSGDLFDGSTKNYRYLGKNKKRKKIVSHTMAPINESYRIYFDKLHEFEAKFQKTGDVVIKPHMKVEQLHWCRGVSICMPVEAIDLISVEAMAELVKKILRGETTLEKEFPDYTYTKDDWNREFPEGLYPKKSTSPE